MEDQKNFDLAVVIGRFQPFHLGHQALIQSAFEQADNVLVVIGSAHQPRTPKNPFTYHEREEIVWDAMVQANPVIEERDSPLHLYIAPVEDYLYEENKWIRTIQEAVTDTICQGGIKGNRVAIVGHDKDDTTYYLKAFPSYAFVDSGKYVEVGEHPIDATQIRQLMFNKQFTFLKGVLPEVTYNQLQDTFFGSQTFQDLFDEYNFIEDYKKQWRAAPYPVTFCTVDGVVLQGGHILLIQRKATPGKGLWALPGGFLDQGETHRQGMIRELKEETRLKVPVPIIEANITHQQVFDHPERSLRGRTITNAFLVELPGPVDGKLPKVKGADDAAHAKWFPISEALAMANQLFEDHHSIISMLTARAK